MPAAHRAPTTGHLVVHNQLMRVRLAGAGRETRRMVRTHALMVLAEKQLGLFARRQAVARLGSSGTDALVRTDRLERVATGVYRFRGGMRLPSQRAIAATLRAGEGATLTGPVALSLLDVDGFGLLARSLPYEVLLPPGRRLRRADLPTRQDPDPTRAVHLRGEVRVVGPTDALIDSARFAQEIGERRLRLAHDVLRWRGILKPGRLTDRIVELGARAPGGAVLAELLDLDVRAEVSEGERRLGAVLRAFDPPPEPQAWVTPYRRVDWWFAMLRLAVEYQGSVDHGTAGGRREDRDRDAELREANVRVVYVTASDLERPATLAATVAAALAARAHELGVETPRFTG